MLQTFTVEPDTLELLTRLQSIDELCNTRLVGGTALALLLGHRISVDWEEIKTVIRSEVKKI